MSSSLSVMRTRASTPAIGPSLPTATIHLVFLAVAVGLCLMVLNTPFWLLAGLLLAVTSTFLPNLVPKSCVLLVLGLSQLWREPSVTDATFYALLAGVHLLHVSGNFARHMPWNGSIQLAALVQPIQQFVAIQVVVQALAVGALLAFGDTHGTVPGLSIVAAAMLGIVAFVLAQRLRRSRLRD